MTQPSLGGMGVRGNSGTWACARCDVFFDIEQRDGVICAGSSDPTRWATWWALDGADTCATLRALGCVTGLLLWEERMGELGRAQGHNLDQDAGLNLQVARVQAYYFVHDIHDRAVHVQCFLSGDGKAMQAAHHLALSFAPMGRDGGRGRGVVRKATESVRWM